MTRWIVQQRPNVRFFLENNWKKGKEKGTAISDDDEARP
jgi:hypothetical protein